MTSRIAPEDWNQLARQGAHLHRWFEVAEACGWMPRHLVVDGPLGLRLVVPAHLVQRADHDLHDRWLGPLRHVVAGLGVPLRPLIVVAPPFIQTSDPLGNLHELADPELERAFEQLEDCARQDRALAVVWPFLDARHERLLRIGRRRGYAEVYAGASAFLQVEWTTFEDYVASRSKHVRRTIRGELRALEDAGLRTEITPDFRRHATAMAALYRDAFRRRNGRAPVLAPDLFHRLAERPGPGITAQLTWCGERLIGSSLNLEAGGVMDGTFAAFAPAYGGGPAYYNDLVYAPLRYACREGITRLELGSTALYPKVLRGATLRRRITLVRGSTPARHALLRGLGRLIGPWTERKERRMLEALGGTRGWGERSLESRRTSEDVDR